MGSNSNLSSKRTFISPAEDSDSILLFDWMHNSIDSHLWTRNTDLPTFSVFREFLKFISPLDDPTYFKIASKPTQRIVGFLNLYNFNSKFQNTYFSIYITSGERNKVYSIEAVFLLLQYLFEIKKLAKVYTEVYSYNHKAINIIEKTNFTCEGIFKEHGKFEGKPFDLRTYSLSIESWAIIRQSNFRLLLPKTKPINY